MNHRPAMFAIGCLVLALGVVTILAGLWSVAGSGCLQADPPSATNATADCGDFLRGWFFISVAAGAVFALPGLALILLARRSPRTKKGPRRGPS